MKKLFIFFIAFSHIVVSQTITGNYVVQKIGGIGGDRKLTEKSKKVDIYKYTFYDNKSKIELINPTGTQIDTIIKYNSQYDFNYETVETVIAPSKSIYSKDLLNNSYERFWIINDKENYIIEKLPVMNWTISNETKILEGILCKKATTTLTNYGYTIKYTAWYSEKVPVNDGPFDYGGLPGLIFEISAENLFVCNLINFKYDEKLKTIIEPIRVSKKD
ncbi:GLPGLI family protein [Flavobacterium sp. UBA6135]|uniref:GLPGLI family protein n=1 Tax=Flavobacterium sp. UBA6135 TaxID=1946553 RepID=UPI0025C50F6A|nr:GLPGLI family protein [Flavobacterium sp. UBA6135]